MEADTDIAPARRRFPWWNVSLFLATVATTVLSGAAFAGGFLWQFSPTVNLLAAPLCGLSGTIYFAIRGRDRKE